MNRILALFLSMSLCMVGATSEPQRPIYIQYTIAGQERTASYFRRLSVQTPRLFGPDVQEVQRQVRQVIPAARGLKINGYYEPATSDAVRQFQLKNNLTPNGLVNFDTWAVLFRLSD